MHLENFEYSCLRNCYCFFFYLLCSAIPKKYKYLEKCPLPMGLYE